ncbi:hypothetical protein EYF80_052992 [Liparis tanakae]|uniref:Uncharacterized protein n=1 Tax=Liparis tanakae TaxID=230148 RepID=A0A4Z2F7G8_9TELE|nr:hypothetical protein EYF80_052992 [Liparis tanakae]
MEVETNERHVDLDSSPTFQKGSLGFTNMNLGSRSSATLKTRGCVHTLCSSSSCSSSSFSSSSSSSSASPFSSNDGGALCCACSESVRVRPSWARPRNFSLALKKSMLSPDEPSASPRHG